MPHRFEVIRRPPQLPGAEGCWSKLWLFELPGPVLYFDLDVVILGSLDPLVDGTTVGRFFRAMQDPRGARKLNSSVMAWHSETGDAEILTHAHRALRPTGKPGGQYRGDQEFIEEHVMWLPLDGVHSYKAHGILEHTVVSVFHGSPKPHEALDDPIVAENWR